VLDLSFTKPVYGRMAYSAAVEDAALN